MSTSSLTGAHAVQVWGTNVVYCDALGANGSGLYMCGGEPQPPANGSTTATLLLNEGGQPGDFAMSPDGRTIYIADSATFTNSTSRCGGIQRWDTNTAGGYAFSYTLPVDGTNGARALAVSFPVNVTQWGGNASGAALFATDAANVLTRIVDNGPSSAAMAPSRRRALQRTAAGIRFAPGSAAVAQPLISSVSLSGTQIFITVTNGAPGRIFHLFSTTNLALPLTPPSVVATNSFASNGTCTNILTVNPRESQRFYWVQQP